MAKTKLAVTTVDDAYSLGSGAIGVVLDETGIGIDGNKVTGLTGDPRIFSYEEGKVLYYGSKYENGLATEPDIFIYNVATAGSATTWTQGSTIDQSTQWPQSINGHGAVELDGYLYVISWDEATVIKADPSNSYDVVATYNFNSYAGKPNVAQHAGAAINVVNGKIYALFVSAENFWGLYDPSTGIDNAGYANSTVVELDANLANARYCTTVGKNGFTLELNPYDGELYVACIGGSQRYGDGANPDSKLDAVDLSTMISVTKTVEADFGTGDFRSIAFNANYAYLLTGLFGSDYTTFTSYVLQFPVNNVTTAGWTNSVYEVPISEGALFALTANENNHIWMVRGTHVDLYEDNTAGEALTELGSESASSINDLVDDTKYLNSATLLMEAGLKKAVRGYMAPAFTSHSAQAAVVRKELIKKAEKIAALKAKIKAKKK